MDAMKRASDLFLTKMKDLPNLAYKYMSYMSSEYGGCGEVWITAFAHYAQAIEGLSCSDKAYEIDEKSKQWFRDNITG
jgi:hypothetical protein